MKKALPLFAALFFCYLGCTPSRQLDIDHLESVSWGELKLEPGYELYDLRIDLIRQTDETSTTDTTGTTTTIEDRSYHPMGFDLGNGLFFDLNQNLSLRIDQLAYIDDPHSFKVKTIQNRRKARGKIYSIGRDQYCVSTERNSGTSREVCYPIEQDDARTVLSNNRKVLFEIGTTDSSLVYMTNLRKRKIKDQIVEFDKGNFYVNKNRKRQRFSQEQNALLLGERYLIKRVDDGKKLEVYQQRKYRDKLLLTIEKSENDWYVYDRKSRGQVIRQSPQKVEVVENEKTKREILILEE